MHIWTQQESQDALNLCWADFNTLYEGQKGFGITMFKERKSLLRNAMETVVTELQLEDGNADIQEMRREAGIEAVGTSTEDLENLWLSMEKTAEEWAKTEQREADVSVTIADERPIGICFISDVHIGHRGCMTKRFRQDLDTVANTPGLWLVTGGDMKHNAKVTRAKTGAGAYECTMPDPQKQDELLRMCLEPVKAKIIAMITGNHDSWDEDQSGISSHDNLCRDLKTNNLGHGGVVRIKVGTETYVSVMRHKFMGQRGHIKLLTNYQLADPIDFAIIGHHHTNDLLMQEFKAQTGIALRSGTYLEEDGYARMLGYKGEYGVPMVILWPNKHVVMPIYGKNFDEGVQILKALRGT